MSIMYEAEVNSPLKNESSIVVYYHDFYTEAGLSHLFNIDKKSRQCATPVYESINYFLRLNNTYKDSKVIILTESQDPFFLKLLASFKSFYLLSKNEDPTFIRRAVTHPEIIDKTGEGDTNSPLSHREWFVLNHLARKLTPTAIGKIAGINVKTVSAHKMKAMRKLGMNSAQFLQLLINLAEVKSISTMMIKAFPE